MKHNGIFMAIIFATNEKWFDGNLMGQTTK